MGIPFGPAGRHALLLLGAILGVGLAIRLALAYVLLPVSGFYFDVPAFASWALSLAYHGPGPYYETAGFADYPPGFLLILWPLGWLSLQIAPNDELTTRLLVKLPAILADGVLAFVAWLVVRRQAGERAGLIAAGLYTLNPMTWFDSAVWGQVDSIGTLVLFLTIVSLGAGRSELVVFLAALAILIKPQYAIVAPVVAVVVLRRHLFQSAEASADAQPGGLRDRLHRLGSLRLATALLAGALPAYAILALFQQTPFEFIEHMRKTADQYPYASMNAFNPWAVFSVAIGAEVAHPLQAVPWLWDQEPIVGEVTPYLIGIALFVLASVPVVARLAVRQDRRTLWICTSAFALALFILLTRMHERYAFPFFALALPLAATSPRWLACYLVLSVTCFANVYAVYSLPLLHNAGSFRSELLDNTLFSSSGIIALSVVNTVALLWILGEAMPRRALAGARLQRAEGPSRWLGRLAVSPRWQSGEDGVGFGVQFASGGKLLQGLRSIPQSLVHSAELKSSVGVTRGELDGTPQ